MKDITVNGLDSNDYTELTDHGKMLVPVSYMISARAPFSGELPEPNADSDWISGRVERDTGPLSQILKALSGGDRLKIVRALMNSPMCVSDLVKLTGLPQNLVSYDLRILRDAGMVRSGRKGKTSVYSLISRRTVMTILEAADSLR